MKLYKTITLTIFLLINVNCFAQLKYGNYLNTRIGDIQKQTFEALLYYPDREWLYDFDTSSPFEGIDVKSGSIASSSDFYMSAPKSMKWNTSLGASLTFNADIVLKKVQPTNYNLTIGIFQEDLPRGDNKRAFEVELLSSTDAVIATRDIYMHRGGWNILCSNLNFSKTIKVSKVRIIQTAGSAGSVLLDNFMISAFQNRSTVFMLTGTPDIENSVLSLDRESRFPSTTLTKEEKKAFKTIANKVIPLPIKVPSISASKMNKYRALHAFYDIETKGDYARGKNPLYYWRSVTKEVRDPFIHFDQNEKLCSMMKNIGKAWYQTQDIAQKEELGTIITDLVRLAVTFGNIPNNWYNGRGFADGVYYAREVLEKKGLLDQATDMIMQQYSVHNVLFNDQKRDNPIGMKDGNHLSPFFWQSTADHLNTTVRSMILSILVGADTAEKARNLKRFKGWLDNISLNYAPRVEGTLKPDGSWYHHRGNRFDNYAWVAGWRGATEVIWWISKTPFAISKETKKRMNYMADVHFSLMDESGYVGPQDKMHAVPSDGFLYLALAGSPDGAKEIDSVPASYWLAYPNESSYSIHSDWVNKMKAQGIEPAKKKNQTITLSYEPTIFHRTGKWQVLARGVSKEHYHTQYKRNGYLFYNIAGLSLTKEGKATGMQRYYGASLLQRKADDGDKIIGGYNFSRAPGVTSVASSYADLQQIYYQRGTSSFVGGTSTLDGQGVFVQEFDANKNPKYIKTVASGLRFKKSYFFFGNDIVLLSSGISNNGNNDNVETGLMQESVENGNNKFIFSNNLSTNTLNYDFCYSSNDVPWMLNDSLNMGLYLLPNQNYKVFKGSQSFGPLKGEIISTYLTHAGQVEGWYEYILRLNTSEKEMKELASAMKSAKPEFEILQRDAKAHIVRSKTHHSTAYAIFDNTNLTMPKGLLKNVDKPCLIILKDTLGDLNFSISYPDKRIEATDSNPQGWSLPTEITILLKGEYTLLDAKNNISTFVNKADKTTTIIVKVKDGLPLNATIVRKV